MDKLYIVKRSLYISLYICYSLVVIVKKIEEQMINIDGQMKYDHPIIMGYN